MKTSTLLAFSGILILLLFTSCAPTYQRLVAYDHIEAMRGGALLIPLRSGEEKAARLSKYGLRRRADRSRRKSQKQSRLIVEAFAGNFDFCPVYFCFEEDVNAILDNGQSGLFVGADLDYDPDLYIDPQANSVFLGYVETVWQDRGDDGEEVEMLIIRDAWGNGISQPFPGAAEIGNNVSRMGLKSAVRDLNTNLGRFYQKRQTYVNRGSGSRIKLFEN